jgi:hypothetical protein
VYEAGKWPRPFSLRYNEYQHESCDHQEVKVEDGFIT